jgi:pyrimidine-specific ribonucleoside hydrolase
LSDASATAPTASTFASSLAVASNGTLSASAQPASTSGAGAPPLITLLVDTDVAPDDLVALSFLLSSPNVSIAAITVSGTGEAHCAGGVDVVLRLLERLQAPPITVSCGRETPLEGAHAFPDGWRERADSGSGLPLPTRTTRTVWPRAAASLITTTSAASPGLTLLTLGPLTNLADALRSDVALAGKLGPVFVMGGAVHVRGNILGPGAPTGNTVAEWNIYVDPKAAQLVLDASVDVRFVSLDGTNQVPVTPSFASRVQGATTGRGAKVVADLFLANPFMTSGEYYLWDPLAAELAAGHAVGTFERAAIAVEQGDGAEAGYTRPTSGTPNAKYLSVVDARAAEETLLAVLDRP